MGTETVRHMAAVELTEEEALALLTMCALSIKYVDDDAKAALDKLAAYCKTVNRTRMQAEA